MKLFYVTRVNIPSLAAQSVQISSMSKAFSKILPDSNFKLISTENSSNIDIYEEYTWNKVRLKTRLTYFEFVFKSLKTIYIDQPSHIFTRDIVIAFVYSYFNIKVIYEAHKEPRTKTADILINVLKRKRNFLLITISKSLREYYIKRYNFKREKVFDYHDAVFLEKYDQIRDIPKLKLRKKIGLPNDKIIIMHTGSLYVGRGAEHFETIIRNFKQILFIQVGGHSKDIYKYKEYYKGYDNIIFIEHQKNDMLVQYQMCADMLFYPMTKETTTYWCCSPMKVFEFMATGIPILSSNIGSVTEVLNENNSIPFNPENKKSIIAGVQYFLDNRKLCDIKANKALSDVKEKYTWEKRAESIMDFINNGD